MFYLKVLLFLAFFFFFPYTSILMEISLNQWKRAVIKFDFLSSVFHSLLNHFTHLFLFFIPGISKASINLNEIFLKTVSFSQLYFFVLGGFTVGGGNRF